MADRRTPRDETSPLLGEQGTGSHETLVTNENVQVTDKGAAGANLVWILAAIWSSVFLGALDGTIVATLFSPIAAYFNQSNQSSYIGTTYLLSVCCFTPLYGRLSDIIGRRGAMLLALSLFGTGTLLCGFASSMNVLIAARAIAGMGGGGVMTVQSIIVTDLIPLQKRGLYQGIAGIIFSAGAALGGPLGGWFNDQFGWRSAFLFQAPILALSVILVLTKVNIPLPEDVRSLPLRTKLKRIDFLGSLTLVSTVGCLLLGISLKSTEELPWSHPIVLGLISASIVWGVAFVFVETKISPYPVMPIRLMKQRSPLAIAVTNFFASIGSMSMVFTVPLYFSAVWLNSSTDAGLHLLPHSVAVACGGIFAGWIMRRTGKLHTLAVISALLGVISSVYVALWNFGTSKFHLWLDLVPCGFGIASLFTALLISMIANVSREDVAVATGFMFLFRGTGQVLGVSLSGAILQGVLTDQLRKRITGPGALEIIEQVKHNVLVIPGLPAPLKEAAVDSYVHATRAVFIFQIVCNVLALVCSLPIQERPLPATIEEQERLYRDRENEQNREDPERNASGTP